MQKCVAPAGRGRRGGAAASTQTYRQRRRKETAGQEAGSRRGCTPQEDKGRKKQQIRKRASFVCLLVLRFAQVALSYPLTNVFAIGNNNNSTREMQKKKTKKTLSAFNRGQAAPLFFACLRKGPAKAALEVMPSNEVTAARSWAPLESYSAVQCVVPSK
jgi:hypothetical protein